MRSSIDSLMFLGDDYHGWLARTRPLPNASGLRIAFASKLFNNLSHFFVHPVRTDVLPSRIVGSMPFAEGQHLPAHCLAPDGLGPAALLVSNARVALPDGRTLAQASLSEYYWALRVAATSDGEKQLLKDAVCLPFRAFDPECLVTSDGASVLGRLLEHCDYLIVEDADLRPGDLIDHLNRFSLHALVAHDLTKAQGLTGNRAYVLWPRNGNEPWLGGERLW
jgi:hypothetical protein